jgi:hypothetical protein
LITGTYSDAEFPSELTECGRLDRHGDERRRQRKKRTNAIGTGTFSRNIDAIDSGNNTPVAACRKGIARV